jgi:thiol-disulfide isomerase/thioredoxin
MLIGSFLLQAATGATTGDWLVLFYTEECDKCRDMEATLETVACKHRGRINVARVRPFLCFLQTRNRCNSSA